MITCQTCGTQSFVGTWFCPECATRLYRGTSEITRTLTGPELDDAVASGLVKPEPGAEEILAPAEFALVVKHRSLRILLGAEETRTIGRTDKPTQARKPDVDLSPFGAYDLGVSRVHGSFQRAQGRLTFIDLESANGSFLNGQRQTPYEPFPVSNGDRLQLGKLEARVYFAPADNIPPDRA